MIIKQKRPKRWIKNDSKKWISVSECLYTNVMGSDEIDLADHLTSPRPLIRHIAEKKVQIIKEQELDEKNGNDQASRI